MPLTPAPRLPRMVFALALTIGLAVPTLAAPIADPDYETVVPAHAIAPPVAEPPSANPPGLAGSPLVVTGKTSGPRRRFVMRDGTILVGRVLAFDGQMYALRLPHSTVLARKDLFVSVGPVPAAPPKHRATTRAAAESRS